MLAAASVCALVLVVSLAAFSQAAGGGRTVITVVEHGTNEAEADSDGDGADSSGDVFWFSNPGLRRQRQQGRRARPRVLYSDRSVGRLVAVHVDYVPGGRPAGRLGALLRHALERARDPRRDGPYLGAAGSMLLSKGYTDHGVFKYTFTFRLSP